jgi:hypothetical protein
VRAALTSLVLALLAGGCALAPSGARQSGTTAAAAAPTNSPSATARQSAPAVNAGTHEVPTPGPRPTVAGGWRSPAQAVQGFASYYVNWNYRTVSLHLRALAEVSVGQARSMLSTAAGQVGRDYELRRGQIANRGVVEAIAPVRGHGNEYAVVTRERTTAANTNAYQGLAPAWHVAVATVTRVRGLWVLSAWQPQS